MSIRPALFTVALVELAAELQLNPEGLRRKALRRGIELCKRRGHPLSAIPCWCIRPKDAQRLRQEHAATRAKLEDVPDWLTAEQAARALNLTLPAFYQRRKAGSVTVRHVVIHGGKRGNQTRYNPQDISREAARLGIRPALPPSGTVPTRFLTLVCKVSRKQVQHWRKAGCPVVFTQDGDAHYYPDRVLDWMTKRDMSAAKMNRARVNFEKSRLLLAAWLAAKQERAA